jgi:enamine deaminase RidA (YjgF/YER057c/UK114 family)
MSKPPSATANAHAGLPVRREALDRSSSLAVVHDSTAYLAALLPDPALPTVAEQTQDVLDQIDKVLAQCGTSKRKILMAHIYCADSRHFDEVNTRWDAWVPWHDPPVCNYVVAKLLSPRHKVSIQVVCGV